MELIKSLLTLIGVVILVPCAYMLPSIVAIKRNHKQKNSIGVLNFFLGWTFLGWIVALIWAFSE